MKENLFKIYTLLLSTKQKGFALVVVLTFILLLIETVSIGMVVPIFAAITDENFLNNIPILGELAKIFFLKIGSQMKIN